MTILSRMVLGLGAESEGDGFVERERKLVSLFPCA